MNPDKCKELERAIIRQSEWIRKRKQSEELSEYQKMLTDGADLVNSELMEILKEYKK